MSSFGEIVKLTHRSYYFDKLVRFTSALETHFGINHFWYYKIHSSGECSYLGTHAAWDEFSSDKNFAKHLPNMRHPTSAPKGIQLCKAGAQAGHKTFLDTAWEKFSINFNINIVKSHASGIEGYGFGSRFKDPHADERLLNQLPLLRSFFHAFKENNKKLLHFVDDNRYNLAVEAGEEFFKPRNGLVIPFERSSFLHHIGLGILLSLTDREKDILKFAGSGYPANYIAVQLHLSVRTVENYLSTIKCKLACDSKTDLINIALKAQAAGCFD